jgi:hypothetical protein
MNRHSVFPVVPLDELAPEKVCLPMECEYLRLIDMTCFVSRGAPGQLQSEVASRWRAGDAPHFAWATREQREHRTAPFFTVHPTVKR